MVIVCAAIAIGAWATQAVISKQLSRQTENDLRAILENGRHAPPPVLHEVASLAPYRVNSRYGVVETGGPERADSSFVADDLGLEVRLQLHTCRPTVNTGDRHGEINLVDGSDEDLCTSGGMMQVMDTKRGEEFQIHFKLIGAPSGMVMWNARQLVSERTGDETWLETLESLRDDLPASDPFALPATVRRAHGMIETHSIAPPHALLMSGEESEMQKLLTFRRAFRDLYADPASPQAQQVARLLLDSLLESPVQREMSEKWTEKLGEAG
jgi:hypothetical protein